MDKNIISRFLDLWHLYFPNQELPLVWYYSNEIAGTEPAESSNDWHCLICDLGKVRNGVPLAFDVESIGCHGALRSAGFIQTMGENFEAFLSCGIPGSTKGLRYKKTPELVKQQYAVMPSFTAPGKYLAFKRWDKLDENDNPMAVVFFANPDTLSGLFTLVGYDDASVDSVIAPFGAGCASIIYAPYCELTAGAHRAVLGMFDVSARPCIPKDRLTFSVTWPRFERMLAGMDECFLTTDSWARVRTRLSE
ncbi:MAG: DUF169 domain-containing protein [candidate division Zixibacteria bacterium]|nr:DUF169 domain-containing protein [candidate division Zixibacteria bacterium]